MAKYIIKGGNKLYGKINVESAKNAVLPIMAGAILTDDDVIIENCPVISDVLSMISILNSLGVKTVFDKNTLIVNASTLNGYTVDSLLAGELRSSVFMLGALLSRTGKAVAYKPGGCAIGKRPIDFHIKGFNCIGINTTFSDNQIFCTVNERKGGFVCLEYASVGATENLILASVLSDGITIIKNSAKEPEITDLANFLNSMGARIYGGGTDVITICGVKKLHGTRYKPISDRIETGTFLLAAAICGGELEINGAKAENISAVINKISNNTCKINAINDIIYINSDGMPNSFDFETGPYPEFPTDMQAQTMGLLSVGKGFSVVKERVFENRFNHVPELIKMGADISVKDRTAFIKGVKNLHGAAVRAKDLRGGAALVLAGLRAEGITAVSDVYHIERGYSAFCKKLRSIGADIKRKK